MISSKDSLSSLMRVPAASCVPVVANPARSHSHSLSHGRKDASEYPGGAQPSYALPYPFPDGPVWAAIKHGVVMNMVYMSNNDGSVPFGVFRQRSRGALAKEGEVWSGAVRGGRFWPLFDSSDVRRGGNLNTAREIDR